MEDTSAYMQQKDLLLPWFSLTDNALLPARIGGQDMTAAGKRRNYCSDSWGWQALNPICPVRYPAACDSAVPWFER